MQSGYYLVPSKVLIYLFSNENHFLKVLYHILSGEVFECFLKVWSRVCQRAPNSTPKFRARRRHALKLYTSLQLRLTGSRRETGFKFVIRFTCCIPMVVA